MPLIFVVFVIYSKWPFIPYILSSPKIFLDPNPKLFMIILLGSSRTLSIELNDFWATTTPFCLQIMSNYCKKFCRWICNVSKQISLNYFVSTFMFIGLQMLEINFGALSIIYWISISQQTGTFRMLFDLFIHYRYFKKDFSLRISWLFLSLNQQWQGSQYPGATSLVDIFVSLNSLYLGILSAKIFTLYPLSAHSNAVIIPTIPHPKIPISSF